MSASLRCTRKWLPLWTVSLCLCGACDPSISSKKVRAEYCQATEELGGEVDKQLAMLEELNAADAEARREWANSLAYVKGQLRGYLRGRQVLSRSRPQHLAPEEMGIPVENLLGVEQLEELRDVAVDPVGARAAVKAKRAAVAAAFHDAIVACKPQ